MKKIAFKLTRKVFSDFTFNLERVKNIDLAQYESIEFFYKTKSYKYSYMMKVSDFFKGEAIENIAFIPWDKIEYKRIRIQEEEEA